MDPFLVIFPRGYESDVSANGPFAREKAVHAVSFWVPDFFEDSFSAAATFRTTLRALRQVDTGRWRFRSAYRELAS
ncbi:hypothetical protein WJX77_001146 [Trebouxia sp. C0004]